MGQKPRTRHEQRLACWVLLALSAGCQEPTQITLHLKTDVPYAAGRQFAITAASPKDVESAQVDAVVEQEWDEEGEVGALVVVPDGDRKARVGIRVVMGIANDPAACISQDMKGCIVARRRLQFIEHKPLFLPIGLYAICEGVPCKPDTTCNALGKCVPSEVDVSKCGEPDA